MKDKSLTDLTVFCAIAGESRLAHHHVVFSHIQWNSSLKFKRVVLKWVIAKDQIAKHGIPSALRLYCNTFNFFLSF
jgi:hypothetical protein